MDQTLQIPIRNLSKAVRLQNLIIIVFAQYFTAIFLSGSENVIDVILNPKLFLLSLSTVLIAAGGYIINDYYDIKIDYVNRPDEVVIGKGISRRSAIILHSILNFSGILIGIIISIYIGIIHTFSASLLWFYSNQLKRLPFIGNFSIALLTGISIYIVSFIYPENATLILDYSLFAAFVTMIREIVKDMEDIHGDQRYGAKTIPIVLGNRKTKNLIYFLVISFIFLIFFISYYHLGSYLEITITVSVLMAIFVYKLYKADTTRKFSWLSQYCKFILLIGVLSMVYTRLNL